MRHEKIFSFFFTNWVYDPGLPEKLKKLITFAQIERKISILALTDCQTILYRLNKNILMRREQNIFALFPPNLNLKLIHCACPKVNNRTNQPTKWKVHHCYNSFIAHAHFHELIKAGHQTWTSLASLKLKCGAIKLLNGLEGVICDFKLYLKSGCQ